MRAPAWTVALLLLGASPASAQLTDTFSDGDFTRDPTWTGSADRWAVDTLDGGPALRTNGLAARDTIHLRTPSRVAFGRWSFAFGHVGVNLSSFNGARVYLVADSADLEGPVRGYYVQLGTNNGDEIRLYRQDGDAGRRVEVGRSAPLLTGDTSVVHLDVTRTPDDTWTVAANEAVVLTGTDGTYATSRAFGFWVKHTPETQAAFYFDDVVVVGTATRPDDVPPVLLEVTWIPDGALLRLTFSEPVDPATLSPAAFEVRGAPPPTAVAYADDPPDVVDLGFDPPLPAGRHTLFVNGVADVSGNTVVAGTTFAFDVEEKVDVRDLPAPGDVVVNEILYDPPGDAPEFVELFNRSERAFDLHRLTFADSRGVPVPLTAAPALLAPGGYAVATADSAGFADAFPGVAFVVPERWPALNDGGDAVVLAADTTVIDAVAYEPSWGGRDVSLERIDPAGPSHSRHNFAASAGSGGATPGRMNSRYAPDVTPPTLRRAEQVDATTIELVFSEPVDPAGLTREHVRLDGAPAAFIAVTTDTTAEAGFDRPVRGGTVTVDGLRDLTGNRGTATAAPVAALATPGDVVFNEVLFAPLADRFDERPDQPEYVELYNRTAVPLTLRGWYWTGPPDEDGAADTLALSADPGVLPPGVVAPGGFVVVVAAGTGPTADALSRAFPGVDPSAPGLTVLPLSRTSLGLPNAAGRFRLHRRDGTVLDTLAYDAAWHDPARAVVTGLAMERVDALAPSTLRTNWASSTAPDGGTPGRPNSVAPVPDARAPSPGAIVVNEILFDPLARSDDGRPDEPAFVELFNASDAPLDLNGLYWTGAPDETGRADTIRFVGAPRAVRPGGYVVVFNVPAAFGGAAPEAYLIDAYPGVAGLPEAPVLLPVRGASPGLPSSGGLLRLHRPDGVRLDEVAFSPKQHHPGLADAEGVSLERLDPWVPAQAAGNWSSCVDPAGATPGAPNSLLRQPEGEARAPGVDVAPSPFSIERDGVAVVRYRIGADAALVRARVFDAAGRHVRTLADAALAGRVGLLQWDGLDDDARRLPIGIYVVLLEAVDTVGGTAEAHRAVVVLARPFE